jgi:hypothetical protein
MSCVIEVVELDSDGIGEFDALAVCQDPPSDEDEPADDEYEDVVETVNVEVKA